MGKGHQFVEKAITKGERGAECILNLCAIKGTKTGGSTAKRREIRTARKLLELKIYYSRTVSSMFMSHLSHIYQL